MKLTERNVVLYGACATLGVLVVWGFAVSGTPSKNRALMQDRNHVASLECVACFAQQYACAHDQSFPESQQALTGYMHEHNANNMWCNEADLRCNYYYGSMEYPLDRPDSYRYQPKGKESYTLCTSFNYPVAGQEIYQSPASLPKEMKEYKGGDQCFTFTPRTCPQQRGKS